MRQSKVVLFVVGAIGVAGGYLLNDLSSESSIARPESRDLEITATISEREVEVLRESGFEEIDSIEAILQLPSSFARLEATYALAGRSSGSKTQELLFSAAEIYDSVERQAIIKALFARLTEIDPSSALATARVAPFSSSRIAEDYVWQYWAKLDLYSAIEVASNAPTAVKRNQIAQTLYRAVGFVDTPDAQLIETMLGIAPDQNTVSHYLIELSDESPLMAVSFINESAISTRRVLYASRLGSHLAKSAIHDAHQYTDHFNNLQVRAAYKKALSTQEATANPSAVLDRLLAGRSGRGDHSELTKAMNVIVESDVDTALEYFGRMENHSYREYFGGIIARALATQDIDEALYWARENDVGPNKGLESAVLNVMARTDPDRALIEIGDILRTETGIDPATGALMAIAQVDPEKGMQFLAGAEASSIRPNMKSQVQSMLYQQWAQNDPDNAFEWALLQGDDEAARYLSNAAMFVHRDVDMARQLLPRLPEAVSANWRQQIASAIAANRSTADAMAFARPYADQPGYDGMLANIATASAARDPDGAFNIAQQVTNADERDQVFSTIVQYAAARDPALAANYLENFSNDQYKGQAAGVVASNWYEQNPAQAVNWMRTYPAGKQRDVMITMVARRWFDPTPEEQLLIDSITDEPVRMQIESGRIMSIAHSDPVRARQMLESSSMPEQQKNQIKKFLERSSRSQYMQIYN